MYAARKNKGNPDYPTFEEVLNHPDPKVVEEWIQSMIDEIEALQAKGTWVEVDAAEAIGIIIPLMWALRIKRFPDGREKKKKSRIVVRGDLEENDANSTSPVVAWATVRLFLFVSIFLGLYTKGIDFSNAFVQATLKTPVWVQLPRGFVSKHPGKRCLRLVKSLYGLRAAPLLWWQFLLKAMLELGFTQSEIDPCLLYNKDILVVCFVDDLLLASHDKTIVDKLIADLRARGFELTRDNGSVEEFLGIQIDKHPDTGALNLTQKGLIKRILSVTGMEDCNPNHTPAAMKTLGSDPDGAPFSETWDYRSVVGMLMYLAANTRCDVSFSVSQVARFSHAPKESHGKAVKIIVRYLKGTMDKGLHLDPTYDLTLDMWCDSDFAGLHGSEPAENPNSARSRAGYVLVLGGCPLLWKSKLIHKICLSTAHAEYVCLSLGLRELLPVRELIKELSRMFGIDLPYTARTHSRVFQDNNASLQLATTQRLSARTRYYSVKLHHFWSHVINGDLVIEPCNTTEMLADIFTKGTPRQVFEYLRKLLMGW